MRLIRAIRDQIVKQLLRVACRPSVPVPLIRLGSQYGGWIIPSNQLHVGAVCYCAGSGEDISFELALSRLYRCTVYAIDPTPRALRYLADIAAGVPNFHVIPLGLWSSTKRMRFYAPQNRQHVSHSIVNLQRTGEYFEADCTTVSDLMAKYGHAQLDLLKMDIEGAEFSVLTNIIAARIDVRILCVEFDQPSRFRQILGMVRKLEDAGYDLVCVDSFNFTFLHRELHRRHVQPAPGEKTGEVAESALSE